VYHNKSLEPKTLHVDVGSTTTTYLIWNSLHLHERLILNFICVLLLELGTCVILLHDFEVGPFRSWKFELRDLKYGVNNVNPS
jgi:hypothetical protein